MEQTLTELYVQTLGGTPPRVEPLAGAGSKRRYYRLTSADGATCIGVVGTSEAENRAFLALARQMEAAGLRVPHVLAVSSDGMAYLQQDLGSTSLYDLIARCHKAGAWDDATVGVLRQVMRDLPELQLRTARGFDFSVCHPVTGFTAESILWDLNYFKYCFAKVCRLELDEPALEREFRTLAEALMAAGELRGPGGRPVEAFLYRDFQSRNVMVCPGGDGGLLPYYIDFQGGRRGPVFYDVASFLWQARAAYPEALREALLAEYLGALLPHVEVSEADFRARLRLYVFFRMLQVLGAYGYLGIVERKVMFLTSIGGALATATGLVAEGGFEAYPALAALLRRAAALPQFAPQPATGRLTVRVASFSYRQGIPDDWTGNGGGFVFDCRAPHNPGRYAAYRHLTGRDAEVARFLEEQGEVQPFLEHAFGLVEPAVRTYRRRGFTSLMVSFGCTGGQHRSVYLAQHMAERLAAEFPDVTVQLTHREQGIHETYNAAPADSASGPHPSASAPGGAKPENIR